MIGGFQGYVRQGVARNFLLRSIDPDSGAVETPDALPTFRLYGPNGFVLSGTCSQTESGNITAATNASPIVISSTAHGLTTGQTVTVAGVLGNTAANGTRKITYVDADRFSLDGSTGNGAYTSGGTWVTTGLFTASLTAPNTQSLTPGETYTIVLDWMVSSSPRSQVCTFGVN